MIKEHDISTVQYIVAFLSRASRKSHNNKNTKTKQWSIVITIFFRTKCEGKGSKRDVGRKREQGNEQKETRTFPIRATDTKMRAYKCVQCTVNTSSAMLGRCWCVNLGVSLLPPVFGPGKHPSIKPAMLNQRHSECSARLAFDKVCRSRNPPCNDCHLGL